MRVAGALLLGMCAACYAPTPQPGAPCADGACPSGLVCAPATQTCERPGFTVDGGGGFADAPVDGAAVAVDAPPDAQACFGAGLLTICPTLLPTAPLAITSNTNVDTDTSNLCVSYTGADENAYCVVAATTVSIVSNRRLRGTGARPLVVLATQSITIDGTIDVSAGAGANPSTCVAPTAATGAQGGAGGSNQGRGGSGANAVNNLGPMSAPVTTTLALRGGCGGGRGGGGSGGNGGSGGGALYLVAPAITINGTLNASGGGGNAGASVGGGGGGGAGGFIGLDAPSVTIATGGRVFANGGGGGEGGTPNHGGNSGSTAGSPSAASGGSGGANHGGNGGNGSAGSTLNGSNGNNGGTCNRNGAAGGGGGGGAGFTYVFPVQPLDGSVSPPPSTPTP